MQNRQTKFNIKLIFLLAHLFISVQLLAQDNKPFILEDNIVFKEYIPSDSIESTGLVKVNGLAFDKEGKLNWLSQLGYFFTWDIGKRKVLRQDYFNSIASDFTFLKDGLIINRGTTLDKIKIIDSKAIMFPIFDKDSSILDFHPFIKNEDGRLTASYTDKEIYIWNFDKNSTPRKVLSKDYLFDISFYKDDMIAAITNNSKAQLFDIQSAVLLKELKFPKKRLIKISVSPNASFTAIVLENEIKIWNEKWASNIYTFKSNLIDISLVTWLDNQTLILAGENNGIEFWDIKTHKNVQSINTTPKKVNKERIEKDPYLDANKSMIHVTDLSSSTTKSENLIGSISALATNASQNFVISQGFTISSYSYNNNVVKFLEKGNCYQDVMRGPYNKVNTINLIGNNSEIYLGTTYTVLLTNKGFKMLGCSSNHYAKVSQLDYESIEDVALRKVDDKWSQYDYSFLLGDRSKNYNLIKKHSKIWLKGNKEQHSGNWYLPDFKIMKNPSGFDVSASKKYLATYDANGQIQIMFLDEAKMIFDSILNTPIKKAFFTENDDLFFINAKNEAIVLNFKETKAIYRKGFDITQSFDKVESNKENLIAVHDSTNIYIYDIEKKKQVNSIKNTNPSFYIETLKFFPKSDKIVWVANEKKQNLQVQKEIDLPTAFETKPTPLIIRIAISKDKKTIAFGNTLGDILIYSKKE